MVVVENKIGGFGCQIWNLGFVEAYWRFGRGGRMRLTRPKGVQWTMVPFGVLLSKEQRSPREKTRKTEINQSVEQLNVILIDLEGLYFASCQLS